MKSRLFNPLPLVVVAILSAVQAHAQFQLTADAFHLPAVAPGAPAGSYALSGFDTVSLFSGKLNMAIPLLRVGGRGEAGYTLHALVDRSWHGSETFFCVFQGEEPSSSEECSLWSSTGKLEAKGGGIGIDNVLFSPGRMKIEWVYEVVYGCGFYPVQNSNFYMDPDERTTRLNFIASDGTETQFVDVSSYAEPDPTVGGQPFPCEPSVFQNKNRGKEFVATDGSGARFISDNDIYDIDRSTALSSDGGYASGTLYFANGTAYRIDDGDVSYIRDRNGNILTLEYGDVGVTQVTDSLERETNITYDGLTVEIEDPAGRVTILEYDSVENLLYTEGVPEEDYEFPEDLDCLFFSSPCPNNYVQDLQSLLGSITYANGKEMTFRYNKYGNIARVELPTGGAYEYDWDLAGDITSPSPADFWELSDSLAYVMHFRVTERRVFNADDVLEQVQTYSLSTSGTCPSCETTATVSYKDGEDEDVGEEEHQFYSSPQYMAGFYTPWKTGREFQATYSETGGPTLKTEDTEWEQRPCDESPNNCWFTASDDGAPSHDPRVQVRTTTLEDIESSMLTCYDGYNNPTDVYEYAFEVSAGTCASPGSYVRRSHTEYLTDDPEEELNYTWPQINLIRLPVLQEIYATGGSLTSKTTLSYDDFELDGRTTPTQHDTANYGAGEDFVNRGNLTQATRWLYNGSTWDDLPPATTEYDILGNVVERADPRGNSISYEFGSVTGCSPYAYAFPTKITADNLTVFDVEMDHDCGLGAVTHFIDPNDAETFYDYTDSMGRLKEVDGPLGAHTEYSYDDDPAGGGVSVTTTVLADPESAIACTQDQSMISTVIYDGLGREKESRIYTALTPSQTYVSTFKAYDGRGRLFQVSNPLNNGGSAVYTTTEYDTLGRVLMISAPDGSITTTDPDSESNLLTSVTIDPHSKSRKTYTDALGRLVRVDENPTGTTITTEYAYDALDNLTLVCQDGTISGGSCSGGRERSFQYDSLKRLTEATNPESGTTQYTSYDDNGNLLAKVDARNFTTTYTYDALNRVLTKSYANETPATPDVTYAYDTGQYGKGRLASVSTGDGASTTFTYDLAGRVKTSTVDLFDQLSDAAFSYDYDTAGHLVRTTYPSGRKVTSCYDIAGRVGKISGTTSSSSTTYASGPAAGDLIAYSPHGGISEMDLGNGVTETTTYNNRMQPTALNASNGSSLLQLGYDYNFSSSSSPSVTCNGGASTCNNGNVRQQTIDPPGSFSVTQTYGYDAFNRLISAEENGTPGWTETFDYDDFGNQWVSSWDSDLGTIHVSTPQSSSWFTSANRIENPSNAAAFDYDASGNQTVPGVASLALAYDAENRLVSYESGTAPREVYDYDGEGRRVRHQHQTWNGSAWVTASSTLYVYDAFGKLAAEYGAEKTNADCTTCYYTTDALGSTRLITDQEGNPKARFDYLPFGQELGTLNGRNNVLCGAASCYSQTNAATQKFTGQTRDSETGLDSFLFRKSSSAQGRFTGADPNSAGASLFDPQSWNAYSYALNSPMNYVDPDGDVPVPVITGAVGAVVGGVIAGGFAAFADFKQHHRITQHGVGKIWNAAVGGAISGGIVGATLGVGSGAGLAVGAGRIAAVNAGAAAVGGMIQRRADENLGLEARNTAWEEAEAMAIDAGSAALLSGPIGRIAGNWFPLQNVRRQIAELSHAHRRSTRLQRIIEAENRAAMTATLHSFVDTTLSSVFQPQIQKTNRYAPTRMFVDLQEVITTRICFFDEENRKECQ